MELIVSIITVILCLVYCIFVLAFFLQLIGLILGATKGKYLWMPALIGLSIYAILMCSQDSWMWIFPKTLGIILEWGGGIFCLIAGVYLTWKTFTSWKFFLGLLGFSAIILLIGVMLN